MNRKSSLICNIIIVIMVVFACILMFFGINFMGSSLTLSSKKIEMFKYFTVDSNILMGLVSLIFSYYLISKKKIPKWLYSLKLLGTVGVTLTFLTVVFYLGPTSRFGFFSMFTNANLFLHFLIPVLSIITFIFYEKNKYLTFKDALIGTSSMLIYSIYYITNAFSHIESGRIPIKYDWYYFARGGVVSSLIVFCLMLLFTFIISLVLWQCNKKK